MLKVKPDQPRTDNAMKGTTLHVDEANLAGQPITLRIDDLAPLTVKDQRGLRLLRQLLEHVETLEAVREGLEQVRQGRMTSLEELDRDLRKKHGISG